MIGERLSTVGAMIITCPNCQTKYQVAEQAIGSAGRKVMCANCHQSWKAVATPHAEPAPAPSKPRIVAGTDAHASRGGSAATAVASDPDKLFGTDTEAALDEAFAEEEERMNAAPEDWPEADADADAQGAADHGTDMPEDEEDALDHSLVSRRTRDLAKRQRKHASRLPLARIRRVMRMVSIVTLVTLVGTAYWFRVDIVRAYPDLGGLYETVGLPVNIYGLQFSDVETLRTLKDGDDVTIITADIRSVIDHPVRVPPVLVSILNQAGNPIYEWTARAPIDSISPGDVVEFQTQLTSAPADAAHVRLVFSSETGAKNSAGNEQQDNQGGR